MPASLQRKIEQLAAVFAAGVLEAVRNASIEEVLAQTRRHSARGQGSAPLRAPRTGPGGRLARRSQGEIQQLVERICALLARRTGGLRAEQIREELGLDAKELPRPIAEALASKRIGKSGQKRATTYFLRGDGRRRGGTRAPRRAANAHEGAPHDEAARSSS